MSTELPLANTPSVPQVRTREGWMVSLLGLAMVLAVMNTTMFNLALPAVTKDFGLSAAAASWIVTGYSIVFAISSITYGRLSDLVPIRRLLVIALLSLSLAAIAGLFSDSYAVLLLARLVQASGAGAIPSLSLVLVNRRVPPERRGKATAALMSAASLAFGLGPVAGGTIVEYFGWRDLFVVTAVTLLLVPLFAAILPKETPAKGSFDAGGALFIGIGTTGLLFAITNRSWLALAVGALAAALFVWRIRRAKDPFVQPELFRNRAYLLTAAIGIGAYMCSFATLFLMPQILVNLYGLSAVESGLVIFPGSLLAMIVSRMVGRIIDSRGNRGILRVFPPLVLLSMLLFALFAGTSYLAPLFIYMILSVSFTFLTSGTTNEISRLLPGSQIGAGMGLYQLLQFFSGAFAVALTASALSWQQGAALGTAYSHIYWGLSALVLLSVVCSSLYRNRAARS